MKCVFCEKDVARTECLSIAPIAVGFSYAALPGGATFTSAVPVESVVRAHDRCWRQNLQESPEDRRHKFAVHPQLGPFALAPIIATTDSL